MKTYKIYRLWYTQYRNIHILLIKKTYFLYSKEMNKTKLNSYTVINCNELET